MGQREVVPAKSILGSLTTQTWKENDAVFQDPSTLILEVLCIYKVINVMYEDLFAAMGPMYCQVKASEDPDWTPSYEDCGLYDGPCSEDEHCGWRLKCGSKHCLSSSSSTKSCCDYEENIDSKPTFKPEVVTGNLIWQFLIQ